MNDSKTDFEQTAAATPPEGLPPGQMLGEFKLLRLLGRGGMAEVYLAEQTSLQRQVAVKILRGDLADSEYVLRRFEREARAAAALSHPNIVQVYVIGQQDGVHFIAQEYVQGMNLKDYIRRKGPPSASIAVHFMKQMASALQKAGSAGIVHRDIKPENMLITRKGVVKVADFGLAQLATPLDGKALELTQIGTTMGTPLYMSPEQVQGQKLDHRSDIYSLGVTCYHMLAGRPPFRGETAVSVAVQHLNTRAEPLHVRRPDLPVALCQVVHRMMAKDPAKRYPDAGAIGKDLKAISAAIKENEDVGQLSLSGFDEEPVAPPTGVWQRIERLPASRKVFWYAAACVLLAGFGVYAAWVAQPANPLETSPLRHSSIKILSAADEQLELARQSSFRNDEDAWLAVIEHFPADADLPYRLEAWEQLGLLYLRTLQFDRAERTFAELRRLGQEASEQEPIFRGIAGQAVLASLRGQHAETLRIITEELGSEGYDAVANSQLGEYLDEARRRAEAVEKTEPQSSGSGLRESTGQRGRFAPQVRR